MSGVELPGKPVALFNASPGAMHAQASLTEILTTMATRVISDAAVNLPLGTKHLNAAAMVADPEIAAALWAGLAALSAAVKEPAVTDHFNRRA